MVWSVTNIDLIRVVFSRNNHKWYITIKASNLQDNSELMPYQKYTKHRPTGFVAVAPYPNAKKSRSSLIDNTVATKYASSVKEMLTEHF